jgi:hypothetical protein
MKNKIIKSSSETCYSTDVDEGQRTFFVFSCFQTHTVSGNRLWDVLHKYHFTQDTYDE